jgi:cytochrome P450
MALKARCATAIWGWARPMYCQARPLASWAELTSPAASAAIADAAWPIPWKYTSMPDAVSSAISAAARAASTSPYLSKAFGANVAAEESAILQAWEQLDAYLEELISELIRAEDDGDRLTHDELVSLVAILLNAGTDTTRNQLAAAVQVLSDHPDQWALLAEHPELAPRAVEELMRHSPIVFASLRVATIEVELGGVLIPAGAFVLANTAAANRDPAVYDHPDRLDITRQGPAPMLTFGGGVHYCLGAHLARVELAEALKVITWRMPNARCTGPVPWKPLAGISGPTSLPIAFEAGH